MRSLDLTSKAAAASPQLPALHSSLLGCIAEAYDMEHRILDVFAVRGACCCDAIP